MLTFYPRHKFLDGWVLKECVNRRELLRKLRIRENRMYLIVANTVQANSFLAALALRNEKILFFLIIRDHALAQRQTTGSGSTSGEANSSLFLRAMGPRSIFRMAASNAVLHWS